ncbi:MAG: alpha/beta fold hydrolase [Hyphomicrobiaceae bacterium]
MPHVLLVPGLLCTDALFAPQIEALGGIATFSVADHRRHDTMAAIAASILETAPESFVLTGLSMGGYIAFEILRQAPERVTGLVLLDTNARTDRDEQKAQRQEFIDLAQSDGLEPVLEAFLPMMVHPDRLSEPDLTGTILQMGRDTGVDAYIRQQRAIMNRPDNRSFLAEISVPTLVIVGEQDMPTPVKVAEEIAAGIADVYLEIIPHCGHLTTLERPEVVNGLLRGFLSSLSV